MRETRAKIAKATGFAIIVTALLWSLTAFANSVGVSVTIVVPERCTNDNYTTLERCIALPDPNTLQWQNGTFTGSLLSGVEFTQEPIIFGLHKFTMEDAYWYIDSHGVFMAESNFKAMVEYFNRLLWNSPSEK